LIKLDLEKEIERIGERKIQLITQSLCSIALTKILVGQRPYMSIPEFKHLISSYNIKKKNWYFIVKYLEKAGIAKYNLGSCFVVVGLPQESLLRVYSMRNLMGPSAGIHKLPAGKPPAGARLSRSR